MMSNCDLVLAWQAGLPQQRTARSVQPLHRYRAVIVCFDCRIKPGNNHRMTEPAQLSDEKLLSRSHELRLLVLRGDRDAHRAAHLHEIEVRRRFGAPTVIGAALETAKPRRRFWRFWTVR